MAVSQGKARPSFGESSTICGGRRWEADPTESELEAFLSDVDVYFRALHDVHPMDLVLVHGALDPDVYWKAHRTAIANLSPVMARLTEAEDEQLDNSYLINNLAFGLVLT